MNDPLLSLESSLRELETTLVAVDRVECLLTDYNVESMQGNDLSAVVFFLDTVCGGLPSFEDSATPASDAAIGSTGADTGTGTPTTGAKVKEFAENALAKLKDKLKKLPEEIAKYSQMVMEAMTSSTKGLSNSAKQILDSLEKIEATADKVAGPYSIFTEVRPVASLDGLIKGINSLGSEAQNAYNVVGKLQENAKSNMVLYSYLGTEYKFDGTSKFFDMTVKSEKTEVPGLSKTDVKLVCEKVITLAEAIESAKTKLPKIKDIISSAVNKASTSSNKEGGQAALALGGFYRSVVGGYIKYTIKVSKLVLGLANGSIKVSKDEK